MKATTPREDAVQIRPVRDLFLYVPAALGFVFALAGAIALSAGLWRGADNETVGLLVCLTPIALLAAFLGLFLIALMAWGVWALIVLAIAWPLKRARPTRRELGVLPFPELAREELSARASTPLRRLAHFLAEHRRRVLWFALASYFIAQVAALSQVRMRQPVPFDASSFGTSLFAATFSTLIALFLGYLIKTFIGDAVGFVYQRLRALATFARGDALALRAKDRRAAQRWLTRDRSRVSGAIRAAEGPIISLLTARECVGYRISGSVTLKLDDVPTTMSIDDSQCSPAVVVDGDQTIAIVADRIVLLSEQGAIVDLDGRAEAAFPKWLAAKRLSVDHENFVGELNSIHCDEDMHELLLTEGMSVVVYGLEGTSMLPGTGYRDAERRRTITDGDGRPVLIAFETH